MSVRTRAKVHFYLPFRKRAWNPSLVSRTLDAWSIGAADPRDIKAIRGSCCPFWIPFNAERKGQSFRTCPRSRSLELRSLRVVKRWNAWCVDLSVKLPLHHLGLLCNQVDCIFLSLSRYQYSARLEVVVALLYRGHVMLPHHIVNLSLFVAKAPKSYPVPG